MAEAIRVMLVDDHAVVRQGVRAFLQLQPDIEVVGEADGGETALAVAARVEPGAMFSVWPLIAVTPV